MHCTRCDRSTNADGDASYGTIARPHAGDCAAVTDDAVQVVARLRVHAGGDDTMIDLLLDKQMSIARRIRVAARSGNMDRAMRLYREWRLIDRDIKELC